MYVIAILKLISLLNKTNEGLKKVCVNTKKKCKQKLKTTSLELRKKSAVICHVGKENTKKMKNRVNNRVLVKGRESFFLSFKPTILLKEILLDVLMCVC